ncbi:predicted protein [Botrytis cinerea T4]|uniref:Uncharacterized protein n=1 Tax=Botryotinia fuckeliana (strain T4) TaxID=999810 RepID=G2XPX2_BOTF4|nr:predicted protein [Botrytis cinerea T4]
MVIKWQVPRNALYRRLYWKGTPATRHLGRFDSVLLLSGYLGSPLTVSSSHSAENVEGQRLSENREELKLGVSSHSRYVVVAP